MKKNRFSQIKLPVSEDMRLIRAIFFKDNQLFIGATNGLFVMDYKNREFIKYTSLDGLQKYQIMNFFTIKDQLYFQTFTNGRFQVDTRNKTFKRLSPDFLEGKSVHATYLFKDSLFLSITSSDILGSIKVLQTDLLANKWNGATTISNPIA